MMNLARKVLAARTAPKPWNAERRHCGVPMQTATSWCNKTRRTLLAGVVFGFAIGMVRAAVPDASRPTALFEQAEAAGLSNRQLFLDVLKKLHQEKSRLSPAQRWHLRYLDARQASLGGNLDGAAALLREIIDHSGDRNLAIRSTALLISVLAIGHHYVGAYKLANDLSVSLPEIADPLVRATALRSIIQMLSLAGQNDQALDYVRKLSAEHVPGESPCASYSYELNALSAANQLVPANPELHRAISICLADKQIVYANTLRLDLAALLNDEGHPDRAVALLKRIKPSILQSGYQPQISSVGVSLAQAYVKLGNDAAARQSALAAVAASDPKSFTWPLQAAYELLYQIAKRAGDDRAALAYYEKYVAQDKAAMNDAKARALAYQMVRQQVLSEKLKLEALDRKNKVLQLRQELAGKAQEAGRLHILLLTLVIVVIGLWAFRLRSSQLRFRQMARHDGMTGAFNRQHFLSESGRTLLRLRQAGAGACLVVLDLDYFKEINDTYGHAAGDEVLRCVVEICRHELRASDLFGRLGGEEFGILMPGCTSAQGIEIATRIRRAVADAQLRLGPEISVAVSASLGLAHTSVSGYAFDQLFSDADTALYRAKNGGRNRLVVDTGGEAPVAAGSDGARDAASA